MKHAPNKPSIGATARKSIFMALVQVDVCLTSDAAGLAHQRQMTPRQLILPGSEIARVILNDRSVVGENTRR